MEITYANALAVWQATEESKCWGAVDWIVAIRGKPSLVMLGADERNGGEVDAVIDVTNGRIVDCDELNAHEIERLGTLPLRR